MSTLFFSKYQGAGNDFILIDDRDQLFNFNLIPKLAMRRFGVGADGVILLQNDADADFCMRIFNSDGSEAESCGNGLRCFVKYVHDLGIKMDPIRIKVGEKIVIGRILKDQIEIEMGQMSKVQKIQLEGFDLYVLNTGVPHVVVFSSLFEKASSIRSNPIFQPAGTNVNFIESIGNEHRVRTYERGVEAETLSCGTGACAVAAVLHQIKGIKSPYHLVFPGGMIEIKIKNNNFSMIGNAQLVYQGVLKNIPNVIHESVLAIPGARNFDQAKPAHK